MNDFTKEIILNIKGLGIILYSEYAVEEIGEEEDYFSEHYQNPEDVLKHIYSGTIVGFGTGSPGNYILKFYKGYPSEKREYDYSFRLWIKVKERKVCIRDLYDLMEWSRECSDEQKIEIDDGIYHLTVCSNLPESGYRGDEQVIELYFNMLETTPKLKYNGIPMFI